MLKRTKAAEEKSSAVDFLYFGSHYTGALLIFLLFTQRTVLCALSPVRPLKKCYLRTEMSLVEPKTFLYVGIS